MNIIIVRSSPDGNEYQGTVVIPDGVSVESLVKIFLRERAGGTKTALQFTGWLFDRFPVIPNTSTLYYDSNGMSLYGPDDDNLRTFMHTLSPASTKEG